MPAKHGGPRPNSGRPPGIKNGQSKASTMVPTARREMTSKLQERVLALQITPLEVMLMDMKMHYDTSRKLLVDHEAIEDDPELKEKLFGKAAAHSAAAVESASKVAPYIHAKLQTTTLKGDKEAPLELQLLDSATLKAAVRGGGK